MNPNIKKMHNFVTDFGTVLTILLPLKFNLHLNIHRLHLTFKTCNWFTSIIGIKNVMWICCLNLNNIVCHGPDLGKSTQLINQKVLGMDVRYGCQSVFKCGVLKFPEEPHFDWKNTCFYAIETLQLY